MIQFDLFQSIEQKRDEAINRRNKLMMLVLDKPSSSSSVATSLVFLAGQISAYDSILSEIRNQIVSDTLKEWKANA